jgi:hypothetical protein
MNPESLSQMFEEFLGGSRHAVVLENGCHLFDLSEARYSISGEYSKCLLHVWSAERNIVRRVVEAELSSGKLRLHVQKLGKSQPTKLDICRDRDPRSASARRGSRSAYQGHLQRALTRHLPGFTIGKLSNAMDLERSFGPIYARGVVRRGRSAFAVLGVNQHETQTSIDAALTFGILWLDACRRSLDPRILVEGLKLFVPAGAATLTRERMAHLHPGAAKWELYEFDERQDSVELMDCADRGNLATRLVRCPDEVATLARFADSIHQVLELLPDSEVAVLSTAEVAFRWHGLEFARARIAQSENSFRNGQELVFGIGAEERVLDERNELRWRELINRLRTTRQTLGSRFQPLWRLHPERWLESLVLRDVSALDQRLDPARHYSQVPAFSASDRAMLDVLALTREGRLAVLELKADEDIHLPLQGLDYWSRVQWHHARGEFTSAGYFAGRELSLADPLLFLVAPTLHIHPATDTLLHYMHPGIHWTLVGIDERWRDGVRVIFRKRSAPETHDLRAGVDPRVTEALA